MAFTNFYMNSKGNDLNSGSTAADAGGTDTPIYTSTSGNWDGTSVFTPTDSSTPSGTVNVGDWVSIYNTGDSAARYIAQVTVVGAGVNGTITVSTTAKYGTAPTSNSGSRNLRDGGAFADLGITANNAAFNTGTVPVSTKVNIRGSSTSSYTTTYANTTTSRTFGLAGSASLPLWWSGYNVTPGDLDGSPTTTRTPGTNMPSFTCTTGQFNVTGNHNYFSSLDFESAITSSVAFYISNAIEVDFFRCRFVATGANANSSAFNVSAATNYVSLRDCYFSASSTATAVILVATASSQLYASGCTITGGGIGIQSTLGASLFLTNNQFLSCGSHAVQTKGASSVLIDHCSAYGAGVGDFYNITTAAPTYAIVTNNEVYGFLYGIDNTTGTATSAVVRNNNCYGSMTSGNEFGLGDSPSFDGQSESALPFVSSTNLQLLTTANGYQKAAPGLFENSSTVGYASIGAAPPQASVSAGIIYQPDMAGGCVG